MVLIGKRWDEGFQQSCTFTLRCTVELVSPLRNDGLQLGSQRQKIGDFQIELGKFLSCQCMHLPAWCASAVTYAQNTCQLGEAKAEGKGAANEPNPVRRFWRILAVTTGRARRPRQYAKPLIMP